MRGALSPAPAPISSPAAVLLTGSEHPLPVPLKTANHFISQIFSKKVFKEKSPVFEETARRDASSYAVMFAMAAFADDVLALTQDARFARIPPRAENSGT